MIAKIIPVSYLLNMFNYGHSVHSTLTYIIKRILSFFLTILMNLFGWDQEFIFLDNSPYPIPYSQFVIGGYYKFVWRYDMHTKTFKAQNHEQTLQNLPALSLEVDQFYEDAFGDEIKTQYNLSEWLANVKFYSSKGHFPHPVQLISAWSLSSGIWFSYMSIAGNRIKTLIRMMNCSDGSDYEYTMSASVCDFKWRHFESPAQELPESPPESAAVSEVPESEVESSEAESAVATRVVSPESESAVATRVVSPAPVSPESESAVATRAVSPAPVSPESESGAEEGVIVADNDIEVSSSGLIITEVENVPGLDTITELQISRQQLEEVD